MSTEQEAYYELSAYTLGLGDPEFLHQHVVDAYMVQHANETTKPIGVAFGLFGLYLHVERQFICGSDATGIPGRRSLSPRTVGR